MFHGRPYRRRIVISVLLVVMRVWARPEMEYTATQHQGKRRPNPVVSDRIRLLPYLMSAPVDVRTRRGVNEGANPAAALEGLWRLLVTPGKQRGQRQTPLCNLGESHRRGRVRLSRRSLRAVTTTGIRTELVPILDGVALASRSPVIGPLGAGAEVVTQVLPCAVIREATPAAPIKVRGRSVQRAPARKTK